MGRPLTIVEKSSGEFEIAVRKDNGQYVLVSKDPDWVGSKEYQEIEDGQHKRTGFGSTLTQLRANF